MRRGERERESVGACNYIHTIVVVSLCNLTVLQCCSPTSGL